MWPASSTTAASVQPELNHPIPGGILELMLQDMDENWRGVAKQHGTLAIRDLRMECEWNEGAQGRECY